MQQNCEKFLSLLFLQNACAISGMNRTISVTERYFIGSVGPPGPSFGQKRWTFQRIVQTHINPFRHRIQAFRPKLIARFDGPLLPLSIGYSANPAAVEPATIDRKRTPPCGQHHVARTAALTVRQSA